MKEHVWSLAAMVVCCVVLVCLVWRLNVMDEQSTAREQLAMQRDAIKAQFEVAHELRRSSDVLERQR